jgi:uncharacterized membrane protein
MSTAGISPAWRSRAALLLVALAYAAARLWRLTTFSLRPDEIFSLQTARLDWSGVIDAAARDVVHPPLFYLLLKAWIGLGGQSELWLRLLPVSFALLTPVPFVLVGRRLGLSWHATQLALLLTAVNAYLVYYAQELRMYSLVALLTLGSLWLFFRFEGRARGEWTPLVALSVVNLLLVYTHYFGWLVVAGEGLVLLVRGRDRVRAFTLSAVALLLLFAPWGYRVTVVALARGGLDSNIGSFPRPRLVGDLGGYYGLLAGMLDSRPLTMIGVMLVHLPVLLLAMRLRPTVAPSAGERGSRVAFWSLALFGAMPVLVVFVLSQVLPQSIWGTRLLVLSAAPWLLLVGMSFDALRPPWLRRAAVALVTAYAVFAGVHGLRHSGRNDWRALTERMMAAEPSRGSGILVYSFGSMDETIAFYASEAGERRFTTRRIRDPGAIEGEHFWVAYRESAPPSPADVLTAGGYRVGDGFRDGFGALLRPAWRETSAE